MKGRKIMFDDKECIILERKKIKEGSSKPKHYIFSLSTKEYISSLYPTSEEGIYYFDFKGDGFNIDDKGVLSKCHIKGDKVA